MTGRTDPITRAAVLAADSMGRLLRRAAQGNPEAVREVCALPADLRGLGHPFEVLGEIVRRMDSARELITEEAVLEEVIRLDESGIAPVLLDPLTPPTQSPALCARDVRDFLRAVERDQLAGELRRAVAAGDDETEILERMLLLSADTPAGLPFADLSDLDGLASAPLPWLVDGWLLRGVVTVLAAPGGVGKSMLARSLEVSVAHGCPLIAGLAPLAQGDVMTLSYEDSRHIAAKRWKALQTHYHLDADRMGADMAQRVHFLDTPGPLVEVNYSGNIRPTDFCGELRAVCRTMKPALIVVDTLRRAGGGTDGNDASSMGELMAVLGDLARDSGAAVLVLAHTKKGTGRGDASAENIRGSSAVTDEARGAWELRRTADGTLELSNTKANFSGGEGRLHLRVVSVGDAACLEHVGGPVGHDRREVEAAVLRWVRDNPEARLNPHAVPQGKGEAGRLVSAVLAAVGWARHGDVAAAVQALVAAGKLRVETVRKANRHEVEVLQPADGVFGELYMEEDDDVPF